MKIEEALQRFVEDKEECVIYVEGAMIIVRVLEIGDGFIRVRTYPKNEKGKKKAIFA